ncbi:MAG: hypothetical protein JRN29_02130 [Nitrososphaerota archaeon]|nr:hypothetical protein [Nitrososphaerota archaeon]
MKSYGFLWGALAGLALGALVAASLYLPYQVGPSGMAFPVKSGVPQTSTINRSGQLLQANASMAMEPSPGSISTVLATPATLWPLLLAVAVGLSVYALLKRGT